MSCRNNSDFPDGYRGDTYEGFSFQLFSEEDPDVPLPLPNIGAALWAVCGNMKIDLTEHLAPIDFSLGIAAINPFIWTYPAGNYEYDLEYTYADGEVQTILRGQLKIYKDITYANS